VLGKDCFFYNPYLFVSNQTKGLRIYVKGDIMKKILKIVLVVAAIAAATYGAGQRADHIMNAKTNLTIAR
jgi:hypothetical protein